MNREKDTFNIITTIICVILVMLVMSGLIVFIVGKMHIHPQQSTMMIMEVQDKTYKTMQVI